MGRFGMRGGDWMSLLLFDEVERDFGEVKLDNRGEVWN